jgi:hypothetical protein
MRLTKTLLAVFAIATASASPVLAESLTIPANRSSNITFWHTYNADCSYGSKPSFKVTKSPEHGTVTARWQARKMDSDTRNCEGKPVKGMLVTYTPNKGYRGTDVVKFNLSGSGIDPGAGYSLSRSFRYDLTIK